MTHALRPRPIPPALTRPGSALPMPRSVTRPYTEAYREGRQRTDRHRPGQATITLTLTAVDASDAPIVSVKSPTKTRPVTRALRYWNGQYYLGVLTGRGDKCRPATFEDLTSMDTWDHPTAPAGSAAISAAYQKHLNDQRLIWIDGEPYEPVGQPVLALLTHSPYLRVDHLDEFGRTPRSAERLLPLHDRQGALTWLRAHATRYTERDHQEDLSALPRVVRPELLTHGAERPFKVKVDVRGALYVTLSATDAIEAARLADAATARLLAPLGLRTSYTDQADAEPAAAPTHTREALCLRLPGGTLELTHGTLHFTTPTGTVSTQTPLQGVCALGAAALLLTLPGPADFTPRVRLAPLRTPPAHAQALLDTLLGPAALTLAHRAARGLLDPALHARFALLIEEALTHPE